MALGEPFYNGRPKTLTYGYLITVHERNRQTDGQTDMITSCGNTTALCTKAHFSVKTFQLIRVSADVWWSCVQAAAAPPKLQSQPQARASLRFNV